MRSLYKSLQELLQVNGQQKSAQNFQAQQLFWTIWVKLGEDSVESVKYMVRKYKHSSYFHLNK